MGKSNPAHLRAHFKKMATGVILAAIALPTDRASKLSRDLFGRMIKDALLNHLPQYSPSSLDLDTPSAFSARVTSFPAALVAQALEFGGGSCTLDAACSSSLFAVKLACDALQAGRADVMLAGGVSRPDCLYTQIGFSQLRALSPSGRCAPFDKSADGLVVGEGAGMVALKRLEDAVRDGDLIHGVIRGIGLSNDIGGGLLAPLSEGQIRAMGLAYASADWSPRDVQLVECHGAGTPVGDMTELNSLHATWRDTASPCAIGSVKSMIGHLLTAAGAAGMIKVLLGIKHRTLPPSLNFEEAPPESPLNDSPLYVQTEAAPWKMLNANTPRRAAVSAFGFGGTNAHLLLEEWAPSSDVTPLISGIEISSKTDETPQVAVIGMSTCVGTLRSLQDFQTAVFNGRPALSPLPGQRWRGCETVAQGMMGNSGRHGGFIDRLYLDTGEFNIPPNELPDIIPQHLLMLQVAAAAMKDGGVPLDVSHPDMAAVIGMGFDPEATDFHVRWHLLREIDRWPQEFGLGALSQEDFISWKTSVVNATSPPLTATRTLGALGSMVASRIAKTFHLGAPSFVVSCEEASGLKALEIGIDLIQQKEANMVLVGAVDMSGDIRRVLCQNAILPFSDTEQIRPFDRRATGPLPADGAVALVLKRLDQAEKDGNRIYSMIQGIGAGSGPSDTPPFSGKGYERSLERCISRRREKVFSDIDLVEANGLGELSADTLEIKVLEKYCFKDEAPVFLNPQAMGTLKSITGDIGAASGLASVVKTSLCLYHQMLPPLGQLTVPPSGTCDNGAFFFPGFPQYWSRNRKDGLRKALVGSMTTDGNAMHVLLSEATPRGKHDRKLLAIIDKERKRPLGPWGYGLFPLAGKDTQELLVKLDLLRRHMGAHGGGSSIDDLARSWYQTHPPRGPRRIALLAGKGLPLDGLLDRAQNAVQQQACLNFERNGGVCFSPYPFGINGEMAFVFPGSGNHTIGMGRDVSVLWPEIFRKMDFETEELKTQLLPALYVPQRCSWENGWETHAEALLNKDPTHMIFGQVVYGGMMTHLARLFGLHPQAVIGYSLGESSGLFALNAWPDRGVMLKRMQSTNLFKTELAGPCHALRAAWQLPDSVPADWVVAVVNRSSEKVRQAIADKPHARLLIVNTPDECVIGGQREHILAAIDDLSCEAIFIQGVVTVHCDAAQPAAEAYRELHVFPATPPSGIRFYSCAKTAAYDVTSRSAADSILSQALQGFDFPATIERAYDDGVRIFLEMGPHASCTRMIARILGKKPYLAVSTSLKGENEYASIIKFLGTLFAENIPVNLDALYGKEAWPEMSFTSTGEKSMERQGIVRWVGGALNLPPLPKPATIKTEKNPVPCFETNTADAPGQMATPPPYNCRAPNELIAALENQVSATAKAHEQFLEFSQNLTRAYADTFSFQTALMEKALLRDTIDSAVAGSDTSPTKAPNPPGIAFSRRMCLEFATGSVAKVLGPEFKVVDTYPARVRLPDEPLMLVDRILSIEGTKAKLGPGRIVTEHDVIRDAWYLDGGRAPVCISVEAGQADLFLCAYLGIDLKVKGKRTYRLLDATVEFFRGLPKPGDVIRYDIEIERFVKRGDTRLFFFHFDGTLGNEPLIRMRNGCAGFFYR